MALWRGVRAPKGRVEEGPEDLFAIAQIAHHYLLNGAADLAHVLFVGVAVLAPTEPYFVMGVASALDHRGRKREAIAWYTYASTLDARNGRSDVNAAELWIEAGAIDRARRLLFRGASKAHAAGDEALAKKARALITHLGTSAWNTAPKALSRTAWVS